MLKKLYQLQQLETAATALDAERVNSDEYRQLRAIRAAFEADKQKLTQLNAAIAKLEGLIAASGQRRAQLEERAAKEKQAMYDGSVTSPKELDARQTQLGSLEAKLEAVEKERAESLEQLMKKQEAAAKLRRSLTDKQSEFSRIRDIYQLKQEERDERSRLLADKKAAVLPEIDAGSLAWFEARRDKFAGTPVACLDKQRICSGCHTMAPPAAYKHAASGRRTVCENCGRTLFVDD